MGQPVRGAGVIPDLESLRTLVEVVGRGSYTATAAHLGLDKSVVSRRVSALERLLRTQLVMRSTRGLRATHAGQLLADQARELLGRLEAVCEEIVDQGEEPAGLVRLTAPTSLDRALIAPVVSQLMSEHPRLSFEILLAEERLDLLDHGIDLAIRGGALPDSRLVVHPLADVVGVVAGSPGYLGAHGEPVQPSDLAGHACLQHAQVPNGGWNFAAWPQGVERGRAPVQANSFGSLLDLACAGVGLAVLPPFMAAPAVAQGRLRMVLGAHPLIGYPVRAVHAPARHLPRKLSVTLQAFQRYAGLPVQDWGRPMPGWSVPDA
ncbi:MAG: LysR family transcriptional regulator [Aquabacterium sp.]|nr:MAG: LysR family transcriptional regulator [Aquabacterium sp.]